MAYDKHTYAKGDVVEASDLNHSETGIDTNDENITALQGAVGTLTNLTTDAKTSLVAAINEVDSHANSANNNAGTLSNLTTDAKNNLVAAINEVDGHADSAATAIGDMTDLETTATDLVGAANELKDKLDTLPDPAQGDGTYVIIQTNGDMELGDLDDVHTLLKVIKITDATTTMGDIQVMLDTINTNGDHVVFDVASLNAGMYLCTIYMGSGYYRIADMVTGFVGTGFWHSSDLLKDVIASGATTSGKHYTVQWDMVNAQGTRLNDASSITTTTTNFGHFGSVNQNYNNPFDSIYPWSERKLCNIDIDTYMGLTEGDSITDCVVAWEGDVNFSYSHQYGVWVYTPAFFGRTYTLGNYRYFDVTEENLQNNIAYKESIRGRYLGCDVTLTIGGSSKHCNLPTLGMPMANIAISTQHTYAKNYGGMLTDIYAVDASTLLFVVEYANMNAQASIGNGVSDMYQTGLKLASNVTNSDTITLTASNAKIVVGTIIDIGTSGESENVARTYVTAVNGATLTLDHAVTATTDHVVAIHGRANIADSDIGSKSGYIGTNGRADAYYRGEVMYGNKFHYILGVYRQTGTGHIWICDEDTTNDYDALNTSVHHDTGIVLPSQASANTEGWIKTLAIPDSLSAFGFPTAFGGSNTAPIGDYGWVPALSTGNTILRLGSDASAGAACGPWSGYWYNAAGNSWWSSGSVALLKNP